MAAESDDEFFDCDAEGEDKVASVHVSKPSCAASNGSVKPSSASSAFSRQTPQSSNGSQSSSSITTTDSSVWGGRLSLPAQMYSRANFSVWSFLKQCIGRELSKITMPVVLNEPLSFLQRVVEYMEYEQLLVRASTCSDPIERHELVTAFAVSAAASNWERIGKPFNPLLGETYELDRPDLGIRILCEQVSHHPPISAFHVESDLFVFHGSIHPKLKFWGKSVEVTPKGLVTLVLKRHNEAYSWQNVNCCVHNVIVGKIWIEHYGAMEMTNHTTKCKTTVNFRPCGWFGRDLHKVEGFLVDRNNKKLRAFYGKWIEAMYSYNVDAWDEYLRASAGATSADTTSKSSSARVNKDRSSASEFSPTSSSSSSQVQSRHHLSKKKKVPTATLR